MSESASQINGRPCKQQSRGDPSSRAPLLFHSDPQMLHQGANNVAKTHFCSSEMRLLKSYHLLPTTKCKLHLERANAQQ